jgi:adhesin/invasin
MTAASAFVAPTDGNYSETFEFPDTAAIENAGATAVILAFRPSTPPPPGIAITDTLPTLLTVGDAVSASITATLIGGATGPVTITATPLPDGVSLGSVTDNGDGTYTAPVTGTVTTAQTVDVAINATNGTQNATEVDVSITVNEAPSGDIPTYIGFAAVAPTTQVSSNTVALPAGTAADDYALLLTTIYKEQLASTPAGWTLLGSGIMTANQRGATLFGKKLTSADIAAGSVTVAIPSSWYSTSAIGVWRGVDDTSVVVTTNLHATDAGWGPFNLTATGMDVGANSEMVSIFATDNLAGYGYDPSVPSGWTNVGVIRGSDAFTSTRMARLDVADGGTVADAVSTQANDHGGWIAFMVKLPPA